MNKSIALLTAGLLTASTASVAGASAAQARATPFSTPSDYVQHLVDFGGGGNVYMLYDSQTDYELVTVETDARNRAVRLSDRAGDQRYLMDDGSVYTYKRSDWFAKKEKGYASGAESRATVLNPLVFPALSVTKDVDVASSADSITVSGGGYSTTCTAPTKSNVEALCDTTKDGELFSQLLQDYYFDNTVEKPYIPQRITPMNYNPKVNAHPTPAGLRRVLDRVAVKLPGALLGGYRGGSFEETLFGQPVRRSWYTRVFNNPNSAVSFLYFDGRVNEFSGFEAYLQRQKDQSDDNDYEFVSNFSYKNKVASWKSVSVYGPKPNQVSTDWVAAKAYKGGIIEVMAPTLSHARKVLAAIR